MYGTDLVTTGGLATGLAATGLAVGSMTLFVLGGIFIVVGICVLLKKNSVNRP